MNTLSDNEKHISEVFSTMRNSIEVPHSDAIKARQLLVSTPKLEREDLISFIASFLNLRVKLYHVVIGFVAIWLCYLYFEQKPPTLKQEASGRTTESALAATTNNTLLPSIQTFCQKK